MGVMLCPMTEPPDETPPPEEIEMGAEEFLGRPISGNAAERIEALQKRISYIHQQQAKADASEFKRLAAELSAAERQLKDWKRQYESRN
jgi:FixJ family two-component response regulator